MTDYKDRKNRVSQKVSTMGKIPPQVLDFEDAVLGALLLEKNVIFEVVDLLKPEMFYTDANQKIYSAILSLYVLRNPVDILTVTAELRKKGDLEIVGGAYYITNLTNRVASSANIEYHSRIIMEKYLQRKLIEEGTELISQSYEDTADPFQILGKLSTFVANAEMGFIGSQEKHISDIATEVMLARENAPRDDNSIHGLPCGVDELDKLIDGFGGGELIVIAARPAMGKTAVICSIAKAMNIDHNHPLAIFSLEMSYKQIYLRLESNVSGINGNSIKKNSLTQTERVKLVETDTKLSNGSLVIDDQSFISISQVISRIRMYVRKHKVKSIFVDYLQLINGELGKGANREAEISAMTRALKVCAGELNIPIIILAQLSREVEKRKPLCLPMLSDLRESGAIEQDADKVIFLWRPEYYGVDEPTFFRLFNRKIENKNLLVFIVAKHREGELGNIPALFTPWNMRVSNHPDLTSEIPIIDPVKEVNANIIPFPTNEKFSDNPDQDEDLPF